MDWRDITYLEKGNAKQKEIYAILTESRVMKILTPFDPVLTGTYPIGIFLPGSDLDIVCEYVRAEHFETELRISFSHHGNFQFKRKSIRGHESLIARFEYNSYRFEIFGQQKAVEEQYAYRHMIKEYEILQANDDDFREGIISLKEKGLSTEEAFASLLGIEGDPYIELLNFEL
jgi:hypothetical protein